MVDSASRFWDNYINKTKAYISNPKVLQWYVKHIERYIKSHPELRLRHHSSREITNYLNSLVKRPKIKDWQFRQVVNALRILFCEIINPDWIKDFGWQEWLDMAQSLPSDHPTLAREPLYY